MKSINTKLSLYNNTKLVIENYINLIDINDTKIIIDKYTIIGKNLKIKEMNNYFIVIIGIINNISLENDNK